MPALLDLQNNFMRALMNNNQEDLPALNICKNNLSTKQRLQIYHNNSLTTLIESLQNIYPAILRLVGENFFSATVKEFIVKALPANGCLDDFGGDFADFLAKFVHTQTMVYLPAVAHFEWACHQAYYSQNSLPLDLARLKNIPHEKYGQLKFKLHPSHRLLEYPMPILDIWQMCQQPNIPDYTVNLSSGEQKILVIRPELTVNMLILSAGEFALLSAFAREIDFTEACDLALRAEPSLKIEVCLQKHLLNKHIVDFSIAEYTL